MDAQTCLEKLKLCGVLSFATVDEQGAPQIRCISAVHYEPGRIFFLTARGKSFYDELTRDGRVQVLAYTRFKEMIRLWGTARLAKNQKAMVDTIFAEQPYLANVYPGDTRDILAIFELGSFNIEYFNLGVKPILRESYQVGGAAAAAKGYRIGSGCVGCGTCAKHCPQSCIVPGSVYSIQPEHCLHCGACYENCPAGAVERLG